MTLEGVCMQFEDEKDYLLSIRRGNNDYLPLEWNVLPCYEGENLHTLEGIDEFTSKQFKTSLMLVALEEKIVSEDERFQDVVIIFKEKGKYREVKEGSIFKDRCEVLNRDYLISQIISYGELKDFRNYILNLNFGDEKSFALDKFMFFIKNYEAFSAKGEKALNIGLQIIKDIPYKEYRKLAISIINRIDLMNSHKEKNNLLMKKDAA